MTQLTQATAAANTITDGAQTHQYLTFMLGGEVFAIGILFIKEIIEYSSLTEVPMMPAAVRGVINLRGAVVPVTDLLIRFGKKSSTVTKRTCVVIVEVTGQGERQDVGVVVDAVDSVSHGFGLRGLDAQTRGTTRDSDHERFADGATGHAFFLRGEFVAYAYVWPDGRVGPLSCASQAYLVQIFAYALLSLTRTYGASWCSALVPGANLRIARAALRAGLRIEEVSLLTGDAFQGDLSTYVGYHALLF